MNIVSILPASWRRALARGLRKAAAFPVVSEWITASFLEPTWSTLISEGVKANGAVYSCILALVFGFIEPRLSVVDDDGEPVPNHPLLRLLRKPNAMMGESEFASYLVSYLAIGGNTYLHKVRNKAGRVIELWPYHAGQISPVPGGENWIQYYEYDRGDGHKTQVPVEDIIHIKWPVPDPEQPWMATPPLLHVAKEVDTDNEATRYLYALLKNDALPRTVLELPPDRILNVQERERLREQFGAGFGSTKRGSVAILEGGAKLNRIGLDLQELAFDALRRVPESRIAAAFRVPPIVAGLSVGLERSTYANYAEANRAFTEGTLATLWRLVSSELTQGLADEFGGGVSVVYDLSQVKALREDEEARWRRVGAAVAGGWITVNEARRTIGLEPVANGDIFLRSMAMMPESAGIKALNVDDAETKGRRIEAARKVGETLIALRMATAQNMEKELDAYFADLAEKVAGRAVNWSKRLQAGLEQKALPGVDDLLTGEDRDALGNIIKRYYADLIHVSWGVWDAALGTVIAFDLTDPAITEVLNEAATRVRMIDDTTRDKIRELLKHGNEHGWSVDHLVRGDKENGIPGLRDIVQQTYKNRGRTIARTELGTAQQRVAMSRYERAGVKKVLVLDNGFDDSHETCRWIAGQVRDLEWTRSDHPEEGPLGVKNPLQHPNCVRCFAPYFEY